MGLIEPRQHDDQVTSRLERWAAERAESRALVFLEDGDTETGSLSFAELHRAALEMARALHGFDVAGRTVLILTRSGLDFATAFFGCLYAGAIAVPCPPASQERAWNRIAAIAGDATPALAIIDRAPAFLHTGVRSLGIPALRLDQAAGAPAATRPLSVDGPALLQYTSGSTASPKGVVITHRNIASNLSMQAQSFGIGDTSVYLTWLPLFHDMGLIGNLLAAVYNGVACVLMPPQAFYRRPERWLSAISRYGATFSGGPNFAYEHCIRRFHRMDLAGIDLSRWEVAFCGAEPVRPATLRRFADLFAATGFRAAAFHPCYGLAEATVFVTGGKRAGRFTTALSESGMEAVSCGLAAPGSSVVVVDPDRAVALPDGHVGEIWVAGDHVAKGYWGQPVSTRAVFEARMSVSGSGSYLRTGDLGWMRQGELYIAGRLKDLIVYRGSSFHPEDIEAAARKSYPGFADGSAAFSIDAGNEEQVVLVQELARPLPQSYDLAAALAALSQAVANAHGIRLYDAALVRPGAIPRTTSGKVQRGRCREIYREGGLDRSMRASIMQGLQRAREPAAP